MRKLAGIVLVILVAMAGIEILSSYILFRHYSSLGRSYQPAGSAAYELLQRIVAKTEGRRDVVALSIDHGPLFRPDEALGFAVNPGQYYVTEELDHQRHRFRLSMDELGRRRTSYVPVKAARRIFITGDSGMFGWGLDDEQTLPWLMQTRLPGFEVINLSVTSYSTIQTLLLLRQVKPPITADDIVVLTYHPVTNKFNVASSDVLKDLLMGYETQLSDSKRHGKMYMPFGSIDAAGNYTVKRIDIECGLDEIKTRCAHSDVSMSDAQRVTERAFDDLMAFQPAHVVVAFIGGEDSDPVIAYLRQKGVLIADLRSLKGEPDANDEVPIDEHAGPFWHHLSFERLLAALQNAKLID